MAIGDISEEEESRRRRILQAGGSVPPPSTTGRRRKGIFITMQIVSERIRPITTPSENMITTQSVFIVAVKWIGATTAGHKCKVKDANDNILWDDEADGANFGVVEGILRLWPGGFKVPTLDSGTLYIEEGRL